MDMIEEVKKIVTSTFDRGGRVQDEYARQRLSLERMDARRIIAVSVAAQQINQLYEAQAKKLLLSISKESKRMDGTTYLVPDYTKFREAIKEAGIRE